MKAKQTVRSTTDTDRNGFNHQDNLTSQQSTNTAQKENVRNETFRTQELHKNLYLTSLSV